MREVEVGACNGGVLAIEGIHLIFFAVFAGFDVKDQTGFDVVFRRRGQELAFAIPGRGEFAVDDLGHDILHKTILENVRHDAARNGLRNLIFMVSVNPFVIDSVS